MADIVVEKNYLLMKVFMLKTKCGSKNLICHSKLKNGG